MDSVIIKRFKYLPEKYEIGFVNITELISSSKIGLIKGIMMFLGFFFVTFFECLKERPDVIHGHWAFPGGYIAYLMAKILANQKCATDQPWQAGRPDMYQALGRPALAATSSQD